MLRTAAGRRDQLLVALLQRMAGFRNAFTFIPPQSSYAVETEVEARLTARTIYS